VTRRALLRSWFVKPPLDGKWTLLWILLALPVAAAIRWTMDCPDPVAECCTPFLVFVLLTAVLLGTVSAIVATIASVVTGLVIFFPGQATQMEHMHGGAWEFWGLALFCLYCAVVIGGVDFTRRAFARYSRLGSTDEAMSGVIFSAEDGQAWVSWPGSPSPVRLSPDGEVSEMMRDFVAQVELGRRFDRMRERDRTP